MLEIFSTKAIVAKARTMYGMRLTDEDYRELIRRQSISEICAYLKTNTHYKSILAPVNEHTIHRMQLEGLLGRHQLELYERLCNFLQLGEGNSFYSYMIMRLEIDQILICIMYFNANMYEEFISSFPGFLINRASFDMIELARANNYDELLQVVKHTPYHAILEPLAPTGDSAIDYNKCEVKLRTHFYKSMLESVHKQFKGKTRESLEEAIKLAVDMRNINVSYRLKVLFNESAENIKKRLIPFYGKLPLKALDEAVSSKSSDAFKQVISKSVYGEDIKDIDKYFIENKTDKIRYHKFKRQLRLSTSAPVVLFTLFELFEIELENVTSIVEGIRYKLPAQEIEKLLIV